jgi:hypothetical protein
MEMSNRDLSEGKGRRERKADNLIAICDWSEIPSALTSHNLTGLQG